MRQWFTMKATDDSAEIVIYDEIGASFWNENSIGAKQFLDDLTALGDVKNITLRINSPGGDVFDGVAIHNALKNHGARITAHVDGIAASIASYIAMAAHKIVMPSNAFMLIHNAAGFVFGSADDMRSMAADLDRIDKSITATYATRSGSKPSIIKSLMAEDRLLDAIEAKDLGLADEVVKEVKLAAKFSLRLLPKAAAERFSAETGTVQKDPPPTVAEPVAPGASPPTLLPVSPEPIAEPPRATAEVIDLNAVRQAGIDEHKKYVSDVTDLCVLANAADRVGGYVRDATPIDEVRKQLLALRSGAIDVLPQHAMPQHPLAAHAKPTVSPNAWAKITEKLNARVKE